MLKPEKFDIETIEPSGITDHHNFLAVRVVGKVILNCNDKLLFLLYLHHYCVISFFHSSCDVNTHPLTISAPTDIHSLHCTLKANCNDKDCMV